MDLKYLFFLLPLWLFVSCTSGETSAVSENGEEVSIPDAETLYILHCEACHGVDGAKGTSNAADLSKSKLSDAKILDVILNGNEKGMMPYREILGSKEAAKSLVDYVKTLRK